jgi:GNAT superfamily N-acetyltransferase
MKLDETSFVAKAAKEHVKSTLLSDRPNFEAYAIVNPLVNDILSKAQVLVARRGHRALGFSMFLEEDGIVLVHVYVRDGERRQGIAKELLVATYDRISPEASLESFFPSERWKETAVRYGFHVPGDL